MAAFFSDGVPQDENPRELLFLCLYADCALWVSGFLRWEGGNVKRIVLPCKHPKRKHPKQAGRLVSDAYKYFITDYKL